jgi:hypothetical protein
MPGALDTVDAIGRVRERLLAGDGDDRLVAGGLSAVLRGQSFAAGVELADGWLRVVRQRDQDAALVAIAASLPPAKANALSQQIEVLLARYYGHGWLTDSITLERPSGVDGYLFDYLAAGGAKSADSIRRVPALVKIARDLTNQQAAA